MHDFFTASAGVAGALVGLLFVAISVSADRLAKAEVSGQVHRIRAYAALFAFTNALAVSLFSLIPGEQVGMTSVVVAALGLLFVAGTLLSLVRLRQVRWETMRDASFLIGLSVTFGYQLDFGTDVLARPGDSGAVENIATLVAVCFLVGVSQAWVLIGGPSIGFAHQVVGLVQEAAAAAASRDPGNPAESEESATAPADEAAPEDTPAEGTPPA